MKIFSYPLEVERNPAEKLGLPKSGFVQVIRADGMATLRKDHAQGYAIPTTLGAVLEIGRGLYLQNVHTGDTDAGQQLPQRGIVLLAYYQTRDEIIEWHNARSLGNARQFDNAVADNTSARAFAREIEGGLHLVTGISWGYSADPAAGLRIVGVSESSPDGTASDVLWTNLLTPGIYVGGHINFPYPLIGRPGWLVEGNLSASGTPGVFGSVTLLGETIFV